MHRSQLNIDYKVKDKPWNYKTFRRKYRGIASWCCSVTKLCLSLWDPKDFSTPGSPVLNYLLEFAQTHVHWVGDSIQPSHSLSPPSPPIHQSKTQFSSWLLPPIRKLAQVSYPHPSEDREKQQELQSHGLQNENHSHRKLTMKNRSSVSLFCHQVAN